LVESAPSTPVESHNIHRMLSQTNSTSTIDVNALLHKKSTMSIIGSVKIVRPAVAMANNAETVASPSDDIMKAVQWALRLITMTASTKDRQRTTILKIGRRAMAENSPCSIFDFAKIVDDSKNEEYRRAR